MVRFVSIAFAVIAVIVVLDFTMELYGYGLNVFFLPRQEAVRREVMIQSRAYNEATIRKLNEMRLQYTQAKSDDERKAIAATVRQYTAGIDFDTDRIPSDLQAFVQQMNGY